MARSFHVQFYLLPKSAVSQFVHHSHASLSLPLKPLTRPCRPPLQFQSIELCEFEWRLSQRSSEFASWRLEVLGMRRVWFGDWDLTGSNSWIFLFLDFQKNKSDLKKEEGERENWVDEANERRGSERRFEKSLEGSLPFHSHLSSYYLHQQQWLQSER